MEGRNGRLPHSGNDWGFGVKDGGDIEYRRESNFFKLLKYTDCDSCGEKEDVHSRK